jgi:hypothetical protein
MPHTKQAAGDTLVESPTQAISPDRPARSGIVVGNGSGPVRLVPS